RLEVVMLVRLAAHARARAFPDLGAGCIAVGRIAGVGALAVVLRRGAAGEAGAHAGSAAHGRTAIGAALAVAGGAAIPAALAPAFLSAPGFSAIDRAAAPRTGVAAAVLRLAPWLLLLSRGLGAVAVL